LYIDHILVEVSWGTAVSHAVTLLSHLKSTQMK
jgi:hypothetical protein